MLVDNQSFGQGSSNPNCHATVHNFLRRPQGGEAFFFDFYGTLCSRRFWDSSDPDTFSVISEELFQKRPSLVDGWMRGHVTANSVCFELEKYVELPKQKLMEELLRGFQNWGLEKELLSSLKTFREDGVRLFLVSDNMDIVLYWIHFSGLARYFDDLWVSCEHGWLKTDNSGAAYLGLAKKWKINISNCVLLDDSSQPIELFERLGGSSHRVSCPQDTMRLLQNM